jgi:NAD(P)-dependent dehydrogenase (short-subunit alcohol dehydrogenase family)
MSDGSASYRQRFDLTGRNAIVTGAVGILGRRFCSGLAEFGANVAVVDLDKGTAETFATELRDKYKIRAVGIGCDITDAKAVAAMTKAAVDALGEIHVLHNNVGGSSPTADRNRYFDSFEDYQLEEWRRVMGVNLDGVFLVDQAVGRQMIKQGNGGSIIHTASIYGVVAPDQRIYEGSQYAGRKLSSPAVYSAAKAGVIGLSQYLAAYWADKGIRVNCITPGGVESGQNDTFKSRYGARVPLGRMAQGEEMVNALVWLASDASSYVTGQNIIIDGGLSAW